MTRAHTLLRARSARQRIDGARIWLDAQLADADGRGALIVAPSRGAGDDLLHGLAPRGRSSRLGALRVTPPQLAAELATVALARAGRAPIQGLARDALAARAVDRCADRLTHFAPVARMPGFGHALGETLDVLRRHAVDLAADDDGDEDGSDGDGARADLARLLAAYRAILDEARLADAAEIAVQATARVGDPAPHDLLDRPLLLLDLPAPEGPHASALLRALIERAPSTCATVARGDRRAEAWFAEALDGEPDAHRDDAPPRLAALRRRLFARADDGDDDVGGNSDRAPGRDRDVGEADDSVHAVTAPGEGRECVEIVRQLRDAARAGMPFDRMAVLLRDPAGYLPPLEAALRRAGVPAYVNRGSRRPDPSGRALLALLACAAEDLATVHFADYLSLGQVPALRADGTLPAVEIAWVEPSGDQLVFKTPLGLPDSADAAADDAADRAATPAPFVAADRLDAPDDATADGTPAADDAADAASARAYDGDAANGADGADVADDAIRGSAEVRAGASATPRRWQRLLIDAAVVGGRDRWRQRLEGLEGERTLQLRDALLRAGGATRDASPAADAEATADDADARDDGDIRRLRAELVALRQLRRFALPVIDQLAALPTAAPWGDWLDALERLAVSTLRQPAAALRVLADLRPMRAIGPIALDAVRRTLAPRLAWLQTPPTARRHGRVFVGHVDDARGRGDFDLVCLPGLAEGIFPRRPLEDPLLLDALRRALDPQLPTQARRVDDERLRLRLAVGAAGDRLVISVPRLDALQGQARVPSFYALDLLRAADGRLPALGAGDGGGDDAHALPAPRDASDALDPAEFDLATLAPALHANDAATVTGRGRYLLAAAPALARSLRRRARRWRARFTAADGLDLGARDAWSAGRPDVADALRAALDARRPRHHAHAATALEAFAACPYRFYLRAIVGLRPRPVPSAPTHLDPRTRGALFHEVQAALLQALDDDDAPPLAADRDGAIARADALLDRIAARWRDDLLPRLPQVWQREIEDLRLDLRGWIHDRADDDGPWQPLEVEFDLGDAAVVADGMRVRGAADLIEVHARDGTIRAVDHKTGPAGDPGPLVVGGGEVLQPLLYALAASGRLGQPAVEGALYHCTRRGGYRRRAVPIDDRTVGQLQRVLDLIDHHVAQGFLPAAPRPATRQRPDACAGCDFRSVCGPHEPHRVTIKARQPLQALTNVRRLG